MKRASTILIFIVVIIATTLTAFAQGDLKLTLDQINALRTEPEQAETLLEKFMAEAFPDEKQREETLNDKYDNKTSRDFLAEAIRFISSQSKMEPLMWDADLAAVARNQGTSNNSMFKPEANFEAPDNNPKKAI